MPHYRIWHAEMLLHGLHRERELVQTIHGLMHPASLVACPGPRSVKLPDHLCGSLREVAQNLRPPDAEAGYEAVTCWTMRFVAVKSMEQQGDAQ